MPSMDGNPNKGYAPDLLAVTGWRLVVVDRPENVSMRLSILSATSNLDIFLRRQLWVIVRAHRPRPQFPKSNIYRATSCWKS